MLTGAFGVSMNFFKGIIERSRLFVLLVVVVPLVAGVYAYQTLPKEGEPEIQIPIAFITTVYAGASPIEIESLVTNVIEEELADLKDIKEIRSSSAEGVSVVVAEFDVTADRERSLAKVRERVTDARSELPDDVESPEITELSLSDVPIMLVSIVGNLDPIDLRMLAEDVADELKLIPEVLSTDVSGGRTREIQIFLEPDRLNQYNLTLMDVYNAVKTSDINIPGGMVNVDRRRLLLRTLTEIKRVEDYVKVPLIRNGKQVVTLGDVARVVDGYVEDLTFSRVDGVSSVSIIVKKRSGYNILETSRKVRDELDRIEETLPAGVHFTITADQSKFVRQSFEIMTNSGITGLLIVIVVLFFAMGLRNSIITSFSIPLSLLLTFVLLKTFGLTLNNMVLFSLVLCIGLLVDNAIIVVENAYHHYQLGKTRIQAAIEGVAEIALPVISATLTTMAAFLPMLLMTGTIGEYMGFMPKTVTIALSSSLIVALIGSPLVLSRVMKQKIKSGRVMRPEEDLARLKKIYVRGVTWSLHHRFIMVLLMLTALFAAGSLIGTNVIKTEMFPDIDFDYIYVTVETPPGSDVRVTDDIAREIEKIAQEHIPEAVRVVSTVGARPPSAFELTFSAGTESDYAEITIELLDGKEYARPSHKEIQQRIRPFLDRIPGTRIRFRPLAWGPPSEAPILVKVIGDDLDVLRQLTAKIKATLAGIRGVVDIRDDFSDAPPELRVNIDRAEAAHLGIPLDAVALSLRGATAGLDVREFRDEFDVKRKYDLKVRFAPQSRTSPDMLQKVKVRTSDGALTPLTNIASISQGSGINTIRHVDRRRVAKVTAVNDHRTAVDITTELKTELAEMTLPPGYSLNYEGDYKETAKSFASLKLAYLVAFLLIFALLVTQFNSFVQPLAVLTALPLSIVGALIGLLVTGNNFSIMGFVGLVGLTGIVVNDSIVLVDCINRFRAEGMGVFEAIVASGQQRLRPIISTTVTTIGGIFTLTITDQLWEGLGVVIIFGIAFATVLTLVVVPTMYSLFESFGLNVAAALKGPRREDAPKGRTFYFSRRRGVTWRLIVIVVIQGLILAVGAARLTPYFWSQVAGTTIQAPSALKYAIEALVAAIMILLQMGAVLCLLLIPTWAALVWLMHRRSMEAYYVDITPREMVIATPVERLRIEPWKIDRVASSRFLKKVVVYTGRRRIKMKKLLEDHRAVEHRAAKVPLRTFLASRPPTRKDLQDGVAAFRDALEPLLRSKK